jgi:hypothetical protein
MHVREVRTMNKPTEAIIEVVAPSHAIGGMAISDGYGVRNVAGAELRDSLRLPRGGPHEASFVAVRKYYDGISGGEAGAYLFAWVEFRATGSRWRTLGVKVRAEEAARIARDMLKGKQSKPSRDESPRVGGKDMPTTESQLIGAPDTETENYIIFVRHKTKAGIWARTRGVTVLKEERPIVAGLLKQLEESTEAG